MPPSDKAMRRSGNFFHIGAQIQSAAELEIEIGMAVIQGARQAKAGNFLLWHAAQAMGRLGCERFDLGGYSSSEGYGRFKQDMRGNEYHLMEEWLAV